MENTRKPFTTKNTFKTILLDEMINYLEEYGTEEEKKEFAKNCYTKYVRDSKKNKKYDANGNPITAPTDRLNGMYAKEKFCEKFAPELLPVKKEPEKKEKKSDRLKNWL